MLPCSSDGIQALGGEEGHSEDMSPSWAEPAGVVLRQSLWGFGVLGWVGFQGKEPLSSLHPLDRPLGGALVLVWPSSPPGQHFIL